MIIACPKCQTDLEVPAAELNRLVTCQVCGEWFVAKGEAVDASVGSASSLSDGLEPELEPTPGAALAHLAAAPEARAASAPQRNTPPPPPADAFQTTFAPPPVRTATGNIIGTNVHCSGCGYNLSGVPIGGNCPECGALVNPSLRAAPANTGMAVAAMVLGIVSIPGVVCYTIPSIICGILAIIFAMVARKQVADGKADPQTRSMAMAGLICGCIGLGLSMLAWIGLALLFASFP